MEVYYIGIDIGGTKCAVSIGEKTDGTMKILKKNKISTIPNKPYELIEKMCQEIYDILAALNLSVQDIMGIGISCGGPLDSKKKVILSPPNLPGWDNIPIVEYLENKLHIKAYLHNDADACAVAEWKFGAGKGLSNIIFLTFGTGFGAGLILSGHLYTGTNDMAGEIGHVRIEKDGPVGYGKRGSFEGFCSGGGISQVGLMLANEKCAIYPESKLCKLRKNPEKITAKVIADYAYAGDELCKEAYRISGEKLGYGLSILIDILNPEMIIIGSIFTRSYDLLWDYAKAVIDREALSRNSQVCRIVTSELGDNVGDYAALSIAMGEL